MSYQRIYNQEAKRFGCLRCGHVWISRRQPHYCAGCKSSLWNKPRKYRSPESSAEPTEKRTAATGRAAAKQRPERLRAQKRAQLEQNLKLAKYNGDDIMRAFFDLRDKNLGLDPDKHPFAYKAWQDEARRLRYQQELADEEIEKARRALELFDGEIKRNPARACHDCSTTEQVFKSSLGFPLCHNCENRRQQTIFQI